MIASSIHRFAMFASIATFGCSVTAHAATPAHTDVDFVGKVSQGGSFEVQASQLATSKAKSEEVKAFAEKDVADHQGVNAELKAIAAAQSIPIAASLNGELQKKLDTLGKLSGANFDRAYIAEMAKIHNKDEKIFATEAKASKNADWKAFAAKTDGIVQGHISKLDKVQPTLK